MLEQTSGVDFVVLIETHKEKVPIWRLCFMVF
jgi:hypothetical protein